MESIVFLKWILDCFVTRIQSSVQRVMRFSKISETLNSFTDEIYCFDDLLRMWHTRYIVGIDEAGRGALAGPVVGAAVVLDYKIPGIYDSKCLSSKFRLELYDKIQKYSVSIGLGVENVTNRCNIHWASLRAMRAALRDITVKPGLVLLDGKFITSSSIPQKSIVEGDCTSYAIAAASIIAKVTRDHIMEEYAKEYPGYGFSRHKGYATKEHKDALRTLGVCPIHRTSFKAVKRLIGV